MKRQSRSIFPVLLAFLLSLPMAPGMAQREILPPWRAELPEARQTAEITVGSTPIVVDLALTPDQQQLGLGYRNGLRQGTGMLFVFPESSERSFWMKGMRFCLDIIWIEQDQITGAAESVCPDPAGTPDAERATYQSSGPASHVLEMPGGWLRANGYGAGTQVTIPGDIPTATVQSSARPVPKPARVDAAGAQP